MEKLKSSYSLTHIEDLDPEMLKEGIYLVLMNVVEVPPHLLLFVSGKAFSISTMGPSLDKDISGYLKIIQRRNIPTLLVELELPIIFTQEELLDRVRRITSSYDRVNIDGVTCLHPIKDFCSGIYDFEKEGINLVFDLLDRLKNEKAVKNYFHLNLDRGLFNKSFSMEKYSVFEVQEAIHKSSIG